MNKFLKTLSKYFLLIGIFSYTITKAQYREMVPNGGFEYGNVANIASNNGFGHASDYTNTIYYWRPAEGTFDWWDWDTYIAHPSAYYLQGGAVTPPPRATGPDRFLGLIGYTEANGTSFYSGSECNDAAYSPLFDQFLINTNLRSIGQGAVYKLTFNAAFSAMFENLPSHPEIKIHFTTTGSNLNISGDDISSFGWESSNPSMEFDFALDDTKPYQWQSFSKYFQVPEGWDNQLSDIVVEGYCGDEWGYLFVGNLSVEEFNYCECSSESGSPVVDPSSLTNNGNLPNAMIQGNPWYAIIDNTTSAQFEVFDSWDNVVFNVSLFDAGVLCNCPTYTNFALFWDGTYNPNVTASNYNTGSYLPVGVYNYILTLGNCHSQNTYTGDITIVGNDGYAPQYMYPTQSYSIATCCPDNEDFEADDFGGLFRADVSNNITLGETGPVALDPGCNAGFYAGNSITVGPKVSIQPGAGFVHLVTQSCSNEFAADYNSSPHRPVRVDTSHFNRYTKTLNIPDTSNIGVYPNPSTGLYNVVFNQMEGNNTNMQLIVTDVLGNVISNTTVNSLNTSINLSGKPSGIYILKIIVGSKQYY